jgi:hypothetical protein
VEAKVAGLETTMAAQTAAINRMGGTVDAGSETETTTAPLSQPTWTEMPTDGYCRLPGDSSGSGSDFTSEDMGTNNLVDTRVACRAKCVATALCVAIESNDVGGCEVWTTLPTYASGDSAGRCDKITRVPGLVPVALPSEHGVTDCQWTNHKDSYNDGGNRDTPGYPASLVADGSTSDFSRYRVGHHETNIRMTCRVVGSTTAKQVNWFIPSDMGCGCTATTVAVNCGSGIDTGLTTKSIGSSSGAGSWQSADFDAGTVCNYVSVEMSTCVGCGDGVAAISSITVNS